MASRRKGGSSELSSPKAKKSTKQSLEDSDIDTIVARVSRDISEKIAGDIEATINHHVEHAVREIRSALEDRVLALETSHAELLEGLRITEGKLHDENEALRTRVSELEHALSRQEHEANLVISGLTDDGNEQEDTKQVFLNLCKDTLKVEVKPEEVLKAVRLGRRISNSSRPPAVLVRTTCKNVKARIMACRGPHLRTSGIYLNEDLSRASFAEITCSRFERISCGWNSLPIGSIVSDCGSTPVF